MILIHQISNMDLEYINDIKEYLKYNILNPVIEKIVVFSSCIGFESKIKIDSKKIKYFEVDINLFEMMKYGKKNTKDFVIYSTPFVCFRDDLKKVLTFDSTKVFVEENCYYIFNKNLDIKNERNIEDILIGEKKGISLNIQKSGYYIRGYQYNSYDWRISKTFKSDYKTKEEVNRLRDEVNRLRDDAKKSNEEAKKLREEAKKSNEEAKRLNKDILTEDQVLNFLGTDKMKKLENKVFENNLISNTETFERVGPKRLDVIIVSVNYNDFLIISLMNNIKIFDNITVVTSSSDFLCQKICKKFDVNCIVTDNMYEDGAVFNKGKAVNEGIKSILDPDYILLLDADILVMEKIDIDSLDKNVLYTSDRYIIPDYTSYKKYVSGIIQKDKFIQEINFGFGFFQLFNYSKFKRFPETSDDASTSDILFRDMFHDKRSIDKEVLHIGEDSNWRGRKSKTFLNYDDFNYILEKKYDLPKKTFKICTFYYNPNKDVRREENFLKFLAQFECYQKNLLIGVVDYGDEINIPDYLKENLFVIKGNKKASIWYKELILNRMIDVIDTDYIIWMDSDLIYENLDWLKDINSVVRGKDFVQLFETINYLDENGNVLESNKSIISSGSNDIDRLLGEGYKPGGAWIGKTSILKHVKFFEKMYVGGGDTIFVYGLFGIEDGFTLRQVKKNNEYIWHGAVEWIKSCKKYRLGYLDVSVDHLYHGELKDRNYNDRYKLLKKIKNRGIMLIAFGFDYEKISIHCVESIRQFSDIPIILHTNIPDYVRTKEWCDISNIEFIFHDMNDDENRIIKTQLSKYSKFEQTLYIDVDSSVVSDEFLYPFEDLEFYDILSPEWKTYHINDLRKLSETSNKFKKFLQISEKLNIEKETFIAGGVCFFNKNERVDKFFEDFHKFWKETDRKEDMPGLNGAMMLNKDIVKILSNKQFNNYNSEMIVSHHNSLIEYSHLTNFTRKRYNPKSDRWESCDQGTTDFYSKPKVAFVYDIKNWAFYIMSHNIKSKLYKKFDIDIVQFDEQLDMEKYDVIICFSPSVLPISINNYDSIICGISSHKSKENLEKLKKFKFVFANDKNIYDEIENDKKFYIENGVNTEFFQIEIKKSEKIRIGSIGSKKWATHKGKYRINEICLRLGDDFENKSIYIDTTKDIMSQKDIKKYYSSIDVFVISSISETGPNPLLEAMSCGIPVVSNKVGLAPIIIKSGIDGILIDDINDINSYVESIKNLKNNRNLYNKISKKSKDKIKSWDWNFKSTEFESMINCFLKDKDDENI